MTKKDKIENEVTQLSWQFRDGDKIEVYGSQFHGSDLLSTHRTLRGAATAIVNYHHGSDCQCGGASAQRGEWQYETAALRKAEIDQY